MTSADDYNRYKTHFYCALCGGPFAQVYRTATLPLRQGQASFDAKAGEAPEAEEDPNADTDPNNVFNIPVEENREIPEEVVLSNMGYAASRHREHRMRASREGKRRGIMMEEKRQAWKAYDGRLISTAQMQWTANLRALIHERAKYVPEGGRNFFQQGTCQFLTGKGRIRQMNSWADAFADWESEEDNELPPPSYLDNRYAFQVYQELGRLDSDFIISSIPFHVQCWDILADAIDVSAGERGVSVDGEPIDEDCELLWGHLRGLVGVSGASRYLGHSESILNGPARGEIVTRLGEVDYREAQGSGEGFQWRHDEGLHWIVADPDSSATSFFHEPLKIVDMSSLAIEYSNPPPFRTIREKYSDVFHKLPPEIILEIFRYLTSTGIFSLKQASAAACVVRIPTPMYKRFMQEEFDYYPPLVRAVERFQGGTLGLKENERVDWKGSFERIRKSIRTLEPEDGNEWDGIDIHLKNRNRIWKIVKPIAEEMVETCPAVLRRKYGAPKQIAQRTSVVRGCIGARSGREGVFESAYFGFRGKPKVVVEPDEDDDEDEDVEQEDDVVIAELVTVRVYRALLPPELKNDWSRPGPEYAVCGLDFLVEEEAEDGSQQHVRRFGRRSNYFDDIDVQSRSLIGFVFCFTENVVGGIRLVFADGAFSRPIGKWDGGVMRKVVAPPEFRTLVGITGYINSSGFIEKIGLLEETLPKREEDEYGRVLIAPPRVDLSHDESSVYDRLPPDNVRLLEREGLNIRNWRLHKAEWEVWAAGYHEDSGKRNKKARVEKSLREIVGYYDKEFLRGLQFIYDTPAGRSSFHLGTTTSERKGSLTMSTGETVAAVVISFGVAGVTGILFVTDRGRTSEMFGPRYAGLQKVFGPTLKGKSSQPHRYDLEVPLVVGLHCLFDYETNRFLQLGLILPQTGEIVRAPPTLPPIPFDQVDENLLIWEDGPPPNNLVIRKVTDRLLCDYRERDTLTGWVDLTRRLRRIIIYGKMRGIRFVFAEDGLRDKFFGDTENSHDISVQGFDGPRGEQVIGVFTVFDEDETDDIQLALDEDDETVSASSNNDIPKFMPKLWFLTRRNRHLCPQNSLASTETNHLKGLKFDFNAERLHSWAPIISADSEVRYPWDSRVIQADRPLSNKFTIAFELFEDAAKRQKVDAVKGYINSIGRFCGLLFRRNGRWSDDVFGARSAFEITMELGPGEKLVSAWINGVNALALVTNRGQCTPWFGKVKDPYEIRPPSDDVAIGIYGAVETTHFDRVSWTVLGLLYKKTHSPKEKAKESRLPISLKFPEIDQQSGLPWLSDINNKPVDYELAPMASGKVPTPKPRREFIMIKGVEMVERPCLLWKAYVTYDPQELEQVRLFVNRDITNRGFRALRLRGTAKMGLVTMGEWSYGDIVVKRSEKMEIHGSLGERITRVQVFYQCFPTEDRVVGITIETSSKRRKKIFSYDEAYVKRDPFHVVPTFKWLDCKEGYEVVGFHGVFSNLYMHDIGLVLRPVGNRNSLVGASRITSGGASSRTSCQSCSAMGESTYTDDTAASNTLDEAVGDAINFGLTRQASPYIHSPTEMHDQCQGGGSMKKGGKDS